VIVITGASSGIGLATAQAAANAGAKLVLAARSGQTLDHICADLTAAGAQAVPVVCDVADRAQVDHLAQTAVSEFGRIDTWVNNAGLGIYGRIDRVPLDDARRLFDINFWGLVHGSLAALPHLRKQGGALINVGSEASDAAAPILGFYVASKHAVKGFTDSLRIELERVDRAPVSVTLIQPTAVDTLFDQHARNYMDKDADLPTPMVDPEKVADAILHAATHPTRETKVGLMAKVNTFAAKHLGPVADRLAAKQLQNLQRNDAPQTPEGTLYIPGESGQTHGHHPST
jgi:short-subunit dehydrogenase